MLLLENTNRILQEVISSKFNPPMDGEEEKKTKNAPFAVTLSDFDDAVYSVSVDKEKTDEMVVSMGLPCYKAIKDHGADEAIKSAYGDLVSSPENGYDVTLKIDISKPQSDELAVKIGHIKSIAVGGVFERYLSAVANNSTGSLKPFNFEFRSDTKVWLVPGGDRVVVVYKLDVADKMDRAVARVFLQELMEARRGLGSAPPVSFGPNPPLELKHWGITDPVLGGELGYLSFAILGTHVGGGRLQKAVGALSNFRNFIQYHIKCSKSLFHSRMRARVLSLLQVLNRAKTDPDAEEKKGNAKTFSGKAFKRS